jgi:uncharacterized OB-fold protein
MTIGVYPVPLTKTYADESTRPFWDAASEGRLVGARCTRCGTFQIPPEPFCFECRNDSYDWVDLPGAGTIYAFTVVRRALAPPMETAVPYVSAIIELDGTQGAGARFAANVIDCNPDSIRIGDRVEVLFDNIADDVWIPRFRLIPAADSRDRAASR